MTRLLLLFVLLAAWAGPARAADIPPRPKPFTFVNDQANMLNANDAKKLENGLRKYADTYGTQVVLVTVPSLGGTSAADYARQLGTSWGVGQRDKNNGIVVLLSSKEHQMSIEAGSGLRSVITPELTRRVITQEMTPAFKQGNYFAGLSKGLGTIMLTANPSSNPGNGQTAATTTTSAAASGATAPSASNGLSDNATTTPATYPAATPEPASSGLGMGTILIGVLVIGGGIWLLSKLFRRNNASQANQTPDFLGNRPNNPTPNFGAPNGPQGGYPQGGNYGGQAPSSGSGMGGLLATGAAAAAGAYLGNRLGGSHDSSSTPNNFDNSTAAGLGGGTVPPANAGSDYFASRNGGTEEAGPDYFSGNNSNDNSDSFFSNDNSYDDTSSGDTGGGGFDSTDDSNNSGSW